MFSIRRGTFETNSSSTHSICICKEDTNIEIPDEIKVELKNYNYEFAWGYEKWDTPDEKLAYLVMGIIARSYYYSSFMEASAQIEKLMRKIHSFGVKSVHIGGFEAVLYDKDKVYMSNDESYVDHASELGDLIDVVLTNDKYLKNYLFSSKSFILGGNDNEDGYPTINVDYPHIEVEKGN